MSFLADDQKKFLDSLALKNKAGNNGAQTQPDAKSREIDALLKNNPMAADMLVRGAGSDLPQDINDETAGNGFWGWLKDSADAGFASTLGGTARFLNEFAPIGKEQTSAVADYMDEIARRNSPTKELSGLDYVGSAVGNAIGSGLGMAAEAAALAGAAKLAGLGGIAASAVGAASKLPAIGRGVKLVQKMWQSPFGKYLVANVAGSPFEAVSEAGNLITDMRGEGYSDEEIRDAALRSAGYNTAWLVVANMLEGAALGKVTGVLGKGIGKQGLKSAAKKGALGALESTISEGGEEYVQNLIGDYSKRANLDDLNYDEALEAAKMGAIGGGVLGGLGSAGGAYLNGRVGASLPRNDPGDEQERRSNREHARRRDRILEQGDAPTGNGRKAAEAQEQSIGADKDTLNNARLSLADKLNDLPAGDEYNSIAELLETGSDADILDAASSMGYAQQAATDAVNESIKQMNNPGETQPAGGEWEVQAPVEQTAQEIGGTPKQNIGSLPTQDANPDENAASVKNEKIQLPGDQKQASKGAKKGKKSRAQSVPAATGTQEQGKEQAAAAPSVQAPSEQSAPVAEQGKVQKGEKNAKKPANIEPIPQAGRNERGFTTRAGGFVADESSEFNSPKVQDYVNEKAGADGAKFARIERFQEGKKTSYTAYFYDEDGEALDSEDTKTLEEAEKIIAGRGQEKEAGGSGERIKTSEPVNRAEGEVPESGKAETAKADDDKSQRADSKVQNTKKVKGKQPGSNPAVKSEAPKGQAASGGKPSAKKGKKPTGGGERVSASPADSKASSASSPVFGKEVTARTDSNKKFKTRYAVVPVKSLVASHNAETFAKNDAYPQEMQPRNRDRAYMRQQVENMADNLDPELITSGESVNEGAPIVGQNMVVENGNGRVMAISRTWGGKNEEAKNKYRQHLLDNAEKYGLNKGDIVNTENPILVRVRTDDSVDLSEIINSTRGGAAMGTAEQAVADAKKLKDSTLSRFVENREGEVDNARNSDFIANVFNDIIPPNERNAYSTSDGELSRSGKVRAVNAILAKAYGAHKILLDLTESTDDEYGKIGDALIAAAPGIAKMKALAARGERFDTDFVAPLLEAVRLISQAKSEGFGNLEAFLRQQSLMPEYEASEFIKKLAMFIDANKGGRWRYIADMVAKALEAVDKAGLPGQGGLLGEESSVPTAEEAYTKAMDELSGRDAAQKALEKAAEKISDVAEVDGEIKVRFSELPSTIAQQALRTFGFKHDIEAGVWIAESSPLSAGFIKDRLGIDLDELAAKKQGGKDDATGTASNKSKKPEQQEQTSLEGNNFGQYADEVFGEGTVESILKAAAALEAEGLEPAKKEQKSPKSKADQLIEDDITRESIETKASNTISLADKILNYVNNAMKGADGGNAKKYFAKEGNEDRVHALAEILEQGVEVFCDSNPKRATYFAVTSDDRLIKLPKSEALVLCGAGGLKLKSASYQEHKAKSDKKYISEVPADVLDLYLDSVKDENDYTDEQLGVAREVLHSTFTDENPFPFSDALHKFLKLNPKSWMEWLHRGTIINEQYGVNEDYCIIFEDYIDKLETDKLTKKALKDYAAWLQGEVEDNPDLYPIKVLTKITEEAIIPEDALAKPLDGSDARIKAKGARRAESAERASEKARKTAKRDAAAEREQALREKAAREEAMAALEAVTDEINALYKADSNEQVPLENFNSNIVKQIFHAGYIMLKNAGYNKYKSWRASMENLIDGWEKLKNQGKAYAKRVLDSAWAFIINLPENVSFTKDRLAQTLGDVAATLDLALKLRNAGFGYETAKKTLQKADSGLYNRVKDYLLSAFKAIAHYPRRGIESGGGEENVNVRAAQQHAGADSERGAGVGLEADARNPGSGSQVGSGATTQGKTDENRQGPRAERRPGDTPIHRSGAVAGREQSDYQGGTEKPNDKAGLPGNPDGGRSTASGVAGSREAVGGRQRVAADEGTAGHVSAGKELHEAPQERGLSDLKINKGTPFKAADKLGIAEAVPNLLPEQVSDEVSIEKRLWSDGGQGMLVANGTGTGKTVVGLAQIVRFLQKGAKKILLVVPSSSIRDNWVNDARIVGLPKEVFATLTSEEVAADKVNIITYKSFSDNKNILETDWDLVIMDECHTISDGAGRAEDNRTQGAQALRAIFGHERTGFDDYVESKHRDKFNALKKAQEALQKAREILSSAQRAVNKSKSKDALDALVAARKEVLAKEKEASGLVTEIAMLKGKERKGYEARLQKRKKGTKVLLLSATPFSYGENIYYAEGLTFKYGMDYKKYMVEKLGFEERTDSDGETYVGVAQVGNVDAPRHDLEGAFHDELVESGAMINRRLEISWDYNRRFIKVDGGLGREVDEGFKYVKEKMDATGLADVFRKRFSYSTMCRLLEAVKAEAAVPMIRAYIRQGKKVVLFHDYKSGEAIPHPFVLTKKEVAQLTADQAEQYKKFCESDEEWRRLQALPFRGFRSADEVFAAEFGNTMTAIRGGISYDERQKRVDAFNNADSGVNLISVVSAAGKEGISLHDREFDSDGNKLRSVPRVLINIGMPLRPTMATQTEGRIYRLGQQSNAMFRYLYTESQTEAKAFEESIGSRASTVEHFALGLQSARNIQGNFTLGYKTSTMEPGGFDASRDTNDSGGKEMAQMPDEELKKALKDMYAKLKAARDAGDSKALASITAQINAIEDDINAKKRAEILTAEREASLVDSMKKAVKGGIVTKTRDGVYVIALPNGMNLWFDLNTSQAAILSNMGEDEKHRMLDSHAIEDSGYVVRGLFIPNFKGTMNLIRLTEAATQQTVDHEVYHFVQMLLLTPAELQKNMKFWQYRLRKAIGDEAYSKLTDEEIAARCLEMDADMHAELMARERKPKNFGEMIAWKVTKWLMSFADKFGINTPYGMYLRTASGEMFTRKGSERANGAESAYDAEGAEKLAREKLKEDLDAWKETLEKFKQNKLEGSTSKVIDTPAAMQLAGAKAAPMFIDNSVLYKILKRPTSRRGHADEMSYEIVAQLPGALTNPMTIFESVGKSGKKVLTAILTLKDKAGAPIVIPVILEESSKDGTYVIHKLMSSYGKEALSDPSSGWLERQMGDIDDPFANIKYINTNKAEAYFKSRRRQSPIGLKDLGLTHPSIATEKDLVNYKNQFPALYQAVATEETEPEAPHTVTIGISPETGKININFADDTAASSPEGAKGAPDNLANVVDSPDALKVREPQATVGEVLEEAQYLADTKGGEGEIVVKDTSASKKEKQKTVGFLEAAFKSPGELAKKYPVFRSFYEIYKKAQEAQEKLRGRWRKQFQTAVALLSSNEELDEYLDLLHVGEMEQKEYTIAELEKQGYAPNVIKAYAHTRQLIRNIWKGVNDAHRGLTARATRMAKDDIEELAKKPFIENIMVRVFEPGADEKNAYRPLADVELKDKAEYEVKYDQPHVFKDELVLTKEQLDELKKSPYAHVSKETEVDIAGMTIYKAKVERVAPPIGKIQGYLPHIFEQWMVIVRTMQGNVPVGSGKNLKEALEVAEQLKAQTSGNVDFYIAPKLFNPNQALGEEANAGGNPSIVLSSQEFAKLERAITRNSTMSLVAAREALSTVARRDGRNRFFGNIRHRNGRAGYNTNVIETLDRYISMSSRYCALQPAKRKAVALFERTFGSLRDDYDGKDSMAVITRRYLRYCNGTPNFLETWLTSQLNKWDWWKKNVSSTYGDRTLMALANKVNGLLSMSLLGCFNISSAVVGLTQLVNTYGLIGGKCLGEGLSAAKRMGLEDQRILAEAGIPYNIGMDTPSGFTKRREAVRGGSASAFGKMHDMLNYAGNKGMYFFKQADKLTRTATTLGAYYKGIHEKRMSHKQAIAYAKEINRKANFDYGAADAAGIFQWTAGTGFGELALLFQKYPMKEWELMQSLLPFFGKGDKAQKIRFWGAYFLMAGIAGVPAGEWWDELMEKLLGFKPSTAFKSCLFREYGDNPATRTIAYGVASNVGIDISRRVGMTNMLPDAESIWGYILGPGASIFPRMVTTLSNGEGIKAIKTLNPAIGNLAEAVVHGYSTNSKGQINYIYDTPEKFLKSMGFRPIGESIDSDLRSAVYLDKQRKKDERQKVLMQMVKRRLEGETLKAADYRALREQGITGAQFQKAVKEARMTAIQRTKGRMSKRQRKDFASTLAPGKD